MEKDSGDVNATYKPIPEKDMEENAVSRPKSLVKSKSGGEIDGADEKMLPQDEKKVAPNSNIDINDVKIAVNDKQNGDAKLDMDDTKKVFGGMDKEELMKYANDPFWVRLRWFLFITFWLLWAAMLLGAIMIIYAAPKCSPPPPRTWWQVGPLVEIDSDTDVQELKSMNSLSSIKGFILNWAEDAYQPIHENNSVIQQIKQAKELGIKTIIEIDPTTSQKWFEISVDPYGIYSNYYIWRSPNATSSGLRAEEQVPNNWINTQNKSSWKFHSTRQQFYYAPFEKPFLNFANEKVVAELTQVVKNFVAHGVAGVRIRNAPFLFVDSQFENEDPSSITKGFVMGQYGFYMHNRTEHLPKLGGLLSTWRKIVKNLTEDGPFMIKEDITSHIRSYKFNNSLAVDLPMKTGVFDKTNITSIYGSIYTIKVDSIEWPLWKVSSSSNYTFPPDAVQIVTALLPGALLVDYNTSINEEVLEIRQSPSIMRGDTELYLLSDGVFAFTRVTSGNPGYLVALNGLNETVTIDFRKGIPPLQKLDDVTVKLYSSNYKEEAFKGKDQKQPANGIPISPKSVIVLSYVPPKKD